MSRAAGLPTQKADIVVVGGGPSGLTAAAALRRELKTDVLVLERERATGGIPRHSDHPGYGMRDIHRFISGPEYARRLTRSALDAGVVLETEAQVTGWDGPRRLVVTSPRGRRIVEARAVVLATGARERPRPARRIPGDRPDGVYTTGQLQNLVHIHHARVGARAIVVGAELVSWSAVMTLREAGCSTVAMVSRHDVAESYLAFRALGRVALRVPVRTSSRVVRINGKARVQSVEIENLQTKERTTVECDTVVTTGDWIPDHELARLAGLEMDRGTRGPVVDSGLRTSVDGVFAVGNLVHPVDTADAAALDGQHVVEAVGGHLAGSPRAHQEVVELVAGRSFRWISPQRMIRGAAAPRDDLVLWPDAYTRFPVVEARQGGRLIGRRRTLWPASPGRVFRVPSALVDKVDPTRGPVTVDLAQQPVDR